MLAIRLPREIEARLEALAKSTGRTKTYYATRASLEKMEELEDYYAAETSYREHLAGSGRTYSLDEVRNRS